MWYLLFSIWAMASVILANYPVFDNAGLLNEILIPAGLHIGAVIYRLRATDIDRDYPLHFDATDYGSYVVRVETLPCTVNGTHCQANVYLDRHLVVGQSFKFRFTVRDTKSDTTTIAVTLRATDAPADINIIFPHISGIVVLPEDTEIGTELEHVIVQRHPESHKPATLEIRGTDKVSFGQIRYSKETTTGPLILQKSLDFELQNMYKLQIFALDMYTESVKDTRNIAGFELIMLVQDVQDTPPIFTNIKPLIKLNSTLNVGDVITRVIAIDGDRGKPREIKYGLVSEGNPFTIFFNMHIKTGIITLAKSMKELTTISRSHQPVLLTVIAEEEKLSDKDPPAMSSVASIALLLTEVGNTPPYFDNERYVCRVNENSAEGTILVFGDGYSTMVHDDDMGKEGVFSLTLEGNNGTFEISSPTVVERRSQFIITVRNNQLLDYEARKQVQFVIVARELIPGNGALYSSASVLVYIDDVNDNEPVFLSDVYMTQLPENATANTLITQVQATDMDTGSYGRIHYTNILGYKNTSLLLNAVTGVITIATDNHGFDREDTEEYRMTVIARDMDGTGLMGTCSLVIRLLDVNDETPVFQDTPIQFVFNSYLNNFTSKAFIKAIDKDAEPPNNIVRYEIISGNYENKFMLNAETGELSVRNLHPYEVQRRKRQSNGNNNNVQILVVRAYDLGVPHRWTTTQVHIYPPDTGSRLFTFIVPNQLIGNQLEQLLAEATGAHQVSIVNVKPYTESSYNNHDNINENKYTGKSSVTAKVMFTPNSMVNLEQVYQRLKLSSTTMVPVTKEEVSSSGVPWWILLLLLLLFIALVIALLLCYLLKCCSFHTFWNQKRSQVSDGVQTNNVSSKGIQVTRKYPKGRVGWSSTDEEVNWVPNHKSHHSEMFLLHHSPARNTAIGEKFNQRISDQNLMEFRRVRGRDDLSLEDVSNGEYRILDASKLNITEYPMGQRSENIRIRRDIMTPVTREEMYIKDGDAEILRLQSNNEKPVTETLLNQPDEVNQQRTNNNNNNNSFTSTLRKSDRKVSIIEPTKQKNELSSETNSLKGSSNTSEEIHSVKREEVNSTFSSDNDTKENEKEMHVTEEKKSQGKIEDMTLENLLDSSLTEDGRNRIVTFQRDVLLTKFLVEEQQRLLGQIDTQSLPGSLSSMGTQTDRHQGTQTDVLGLLRPEPRRAKSENDDSSDDDGYGCRRRYRNDKRRCYSVIGQVNCGHRIRTPILEESEGLSNCSRSTDYLFEKFINDSKEDHNDAVVNKGTCQSRMYLGSGSLQKLNSGASNMRKTLSQSYLDDLERKNTYTPKCIKSRLLARKKNNLDKLIATEKEVKSATVKPLERKPRYMEWYKQKKEDREKSRQEAENSQIKNKQIISGGSKKRKKDDCYSEEIRKKSVVNKDTINVEFIRDNMIRETNESNVVQGVALALGSPVTKYDNELSRNKHQTSSKLILKKNQQLVEKKSVFTIAYDDAATEHIGSSNGSVPE